jgi:folylpolyglutamate synthase/dihydropteroate synthase
MKATADSLKRHFGGRKLIFLVGVMADKDIPAMMSFIAPMAERFIAVEPPNPRAMKPQALAELLFKLFGKPSSIKTHRGGCGAAMHLPEQKEWLLPRLPFTSQQVRAAVNNIIRRLCI